MPVGIGIGETMFIPPFPPLLWFRLHCCCVVSPPSTRILHHRDLQRRSRRRRMYGCRYPIRRCH
eukprot:4110174-Pyramimonas_sp.AAC.1